MARDGIGTCDTCNGHFGYMLVHKVAAHLARPVNGRWVKDNWRRT